MVKDVRCRGIQVLVRTTASAVYVQCASISNVPSEHVLWGIFVGVFVSRLNTFGQGLVSHGATCPKDLVIYNLGAAHLFKLGKSCPARGLKRPALLMSPLPWVSLVPGRRLP